MIDKDIENWLEAKVFDCSNCKNELYRVNHSPFADEDTFYCDSCAKRVEISFYDKNRQEIYEYFGNNIIEFYKNILELENKLNRCDCGGKFKYNAPRRCIYCLEIVIDEGGGIELYPIYTGIAEGEEPTIKDEENYDEFINEFVRTKNIWK